MLKARLQFDANERYFRIDPFQIYDVPELAYFGRAKGTGIEAMLTGIPIAFLGAALPFTLSLVYSHVPGHLTQAN
jgi:hypothetical protein